MKITLQDVQRGYDDWAAQPHNKKWVRKIDGTPIANDIVVRIFDSLSASLGAGTVAQEPDGNRTVVIGEETISLLRRGMSVSAGRIYLLPASDLTAPAQEPVAWAWKGPKGGFIADDKKPSWPSTPLYATPQPAAVAVPNRQTMTDHARGCEGRNYTCTCGYDEQRAVAVPEVAVKAVTDAIVATAMLDAWNDICDDTGCHPLDINQLGRRKISFSPGHWASSVAMGIRSALTAAPSPASEPAPKVVELLEGYEITPIKCGGCSATMFEHCRRDGGALCYRERHGSSRSPILTCQEKTDV